MIKCLCYANQNLFKIWQLDKNMGNCEICGEERELVKAIVEGSLLDVCEECSKFGNTIVVKKIQKEEKAVKKQTVDIINIISPDYPRLIKESREKLGLKQKDLALKLNEKESVVHKLETGSLRPTILLARKLERTLNISLIELYQDTHESLNLKDDKLTIGDILKLKK